MTESLYLRQARQHVTDFDRESALMRDHKEAMDCWDVDAILQMGIDTFSWILQADNLYRKMLYERGFDQPSIVNIEDCLELLFTTWLRSAESVNKRISKVRDRGYDLGNLAKFRECEKEVRSIVGHYTHKSQALLSEPMRTLRDEALAEYSNGQTAEFISQDE